MDWHTPPGDQDWFLRGSKGRQNLSENLVEMDVIY